MAGPIPRVSGDRPTLLGEANTPEIEIKPGMIDAGEPRFAPTIRTTRVRPKSWFKSLNQWSAKLPMPMKHLSPISERPCRLMFNVSPESRRDKDDRRNVAVFRRIAE